MRRTIGPGVFVSFAIGLAVGAVAGLFFAPNSGEQLREEIAQGAADGLDQVRSAGKKIGKRASGNSSHRQADSKRHEDSWSDGCSHSLLLRYTRGANSSETHPRLQYAQMQISDSESL
jgi:gas vesicle protein